MKALLIFSVFLFCATIGQAQIVTQLEEVKIGFTPLNEKVIQNGDSFTLTIKERYSTEFVKNPIKFLMDNFDIHKFISSVSNRDYESYRVELKSSKGFMIANYDRKGNLVSTQQNFKNILIPHKLRLQVYTDNVGWALMKNKYLASTHGIILDKAIYKITLQNGNKKRNVTIDVLDKEYGVVASN